MNPQSQPSPQAPGERPTGPLPEQSSVGPEQVVPATAEMPAAGNPSATQPPTPALTASDVAAAIAQMPTDAPPAGPVTITPPSQAADVDVIEAEWVDQAEAVIEKTAGDPRAEEAAVEALQVDYLAKRYGHQVKPDDGS